MVSLHTGILIVSGLLDGDGSERNRVDLSESYFLLYLCLIIRYGMKRTLTLSYLLLSLLFLMGCNDNKHITESLHRAEALMNENPDSAWTLLNTVSLDEMEQNRTRALYALLYTQAQDKKYIDETDDSLISIAVDYYCDTDDIRHKFLSFYYKGRVYTNAKDYLNAMTCYMEAE